jgi:hypothetical protein
MEQNAFNKAVVSEVYMSLLCSVFTEFLSTDMADLLVEVRQSFDTTTK